MGLKHKPKWWVYRELKQEIGFEEYSKYVKGAPSRLFLMFRLGTHGLVEELSRHAKGDGSRECPNYGACKELVEHVLFVHASYNSQTLIFWTIWRRSFLRCFWSLSVAMQLWVWAISLLLYIQHVFTICPMCVLRWCCSHQKQNWIFCTTVTMLMLHVCMGMLASKVLSLYCTPSLCVRIIMSFGCTECLLVDSHQIFEGMNCPFV